MNRAYPIGKILPKNLHAVEVIFMKGNSRPYTYLSLFPVGEGELLIVEVGEDRVPTLVRSVRKSVPTIIPEDDPIYYKWVICKVDRETVNKSQKRLHRVEAACYKTFSETPNPSPELLAATADHAMKFFTAE